MLSTLGNDFPSSHLLPDCTTAARIRQLLRSHSTPPDHISFLISELTQELLRYATEIALCEDEISRCEKETSRWEDEISRLRTHMMRVESERISLKDYLIDCRGLLAPIRRMPSEVLVEIFGFCADDLCDDLRWQAIERLAQKPLLVLSQVCKRWHDVALGTPTLWDTIILEEELDGPETQTPEMTDKLVRLLEIFLERGEKNPLRLVIQLDHRPMLELLAQCSERWKTLTFFWGSSEPLHHLAGAKGRLPWLEILKISTTTTEGTSQIISTFEVAPRLRNLEIPGFLLPSFIHPPLGQLGRIGYVDLNALDIPAALEPISRMAHETELRLGFFLTEPIGVFNLPPTSSNVCRLSMELADFLGAGDLAQVVECVFASLTLPHLRELSFRPERFPASQMYWPQTAFLDLAARSSFTQLWSLHLRHVVIADTDLIACLLVLPSLEALAISDRLLSQWDDDESGDGDLFEFEVEHHLITDALLTRLTLKPDSSPIVPRLRILELRTLLQFDHTVFLEFLLSRRVEQPSTSSPLLLDTYFPSGRELELAVAERVRELRIRKEVTVLLTEVKEEEFKFYQY